MSTPVPRLIVTEGRLKGRIYEVKGSLVIGRQKGVSLQIPDQKASREHAKVFLQGADTVIVDLNSSNGTLVNGAKVTKRALHHNDEITIGTTCFRYEAGPTASPKQEAPAASPRPAVKQVEDLTVRKPASAPAGAIRADDIVVKDRALQFSKVKGRKSPSPLFDDLGQRPLVYQVLMGLVVLLVCAVFIFVGMFVAGVIGSK